MRKVISLMVALSCAVSLAAQTSGFIPVSEDQEPMATGKFERTGDALIITLPSEPCNTLMPVIKIKK